MSRSVNKAIIVGNLGSDPEIRSVASGSRVANVSVATSRRWNDRNGVQQEKTEWHRIVLWEKLADVAERFLKKGDSVYVEGEIEYRSYEDKDGVTKYMTEIRARELVMLGGNGERQPAAATSSRPAASKKPAPSYEDFEDSPFPSNDDLPW